MWDRRVVEKIEVCVGEFSVAVSFKNVVDQFSWAFAGVYGPNTDCDRRLLWDELTSLISWWDLPWGIREISMSLVFPMRDQVKPLFLLL